MLLHSDSKINEKLPSQKTAYIGFMSAATAFEYLYWPLKFQLTVIILGFRTCHMIKAMEAR